MRNEPFTEFIDDYMESMGGNLVLYYKVVQMWEDHTGEAFLGDFDNPEHIKILVKVLWRAGVLEI